MTRTLPNLNVAALLSSTDIPCEDWDEERLIAFCERYKRRNWNALHVLTLTEVSPEDRIWLACHQALCPTAVARRFAVDVAAEALERAGVTDERSWAALDAALAYARGEIDDSARSAARSAASTAASTAAWNAARSAAWDAARAAAWGAVNAAAWGAVNAAAWADHCDLLGALLLRWVDGQDVLAGSVEREVAS